MYEPFIYSNAYIDLLAHLQTVIRYSRQLERRVMVLEHQMMALPEYADTYNELVPNESQARILWKLLHSRPNEEVPPFQPQACLSNGRQEPRQHYLPSLRLTPAGLSAEPQAGRQAVADGTVEA